METQKPSMRKHLCLPGLLKRARYCFERIKDTVTRSVNISLPDCLMSGLAIFGQKYPSLLQFDKEFHTHKMVKHNLQSLYGIKQVPSDTYLRERLDEIEPEELQKTLNRIIALLQRGKILEQYRCWDDYCLVSLDASGYFSSTEIHCMNCCEKKHKEGTITYYHQMLAAVMMNPRYNTVFPLAVEPIHKQDGYTKNDCEHNAAKRLLETLRSSHPHLKMVIVLDALYADGPIVKLLQELKFPFIITAKEKDLKYLFEFYKVVKKQESVRIHKDKEIERRYQWANQLPLNDTHAEISVNVLECWEETKKGAQRFCWITDLSLSDKRVEQIAAGGRSRWKIENETFNTLKNQGYQFEHNFGHGNKNLSTVFAYLMFLAFLIDQIQQFCCKYFKAALKKWGTRTLVWRQIRGLFTHYFVDSWEDLYTAVIEDFEGARLVERLNTS
jgi:hypothetical protein